MCPCLPRAIAMLLRYKSRGVYVIADKEGKVHTLLSLHIKGELLAIVGLDENGKPDVVEVLK